MSSSNPGEAGLTPPRRSAEHGFTPPRRSAEHGFTLIEMLVALAIFSLAALALLRLEGATVSNTARLQDQAMAQVVARNIAVETMTDPAPPSLGQESGEVENGGRRWGWTRLVALSPEPRIQMITISVRSQAGPESATLTIFRRAAL
ncbi:type II secretion system minor pseudopilin GspI [Sphingosinicella humi]|uniref:Type II secretion system protein I n=1 Tax=Allosphingosinicella humi TaxID=2068657 RepID=A0A2U2IZK5_9SPHN|nr:type II secretion system minor pseudopilin GspI [Sphingosinicella humi]PWG01525.1 type II secretion system protein GspI [Sphingosinicella humi]